MVQLIKKRSRIPILGRYDSQHYDTQHNDIQHSVMLNVVMLSVISPCPLCKPDHLSLLEKIVYNNEIVQRTNVISKFTG